MATKLSVWLWLTLGLSGCQHYCLNYADLSDCDVRVKILRKQVAELDKENRRLRLFSSYTKCDDVSTYHH